MARRGALCVSAETQISAEKYTQTECKKYKNSAKHSLKAYRLDFTLHEKSRSTHCGEVSHTSHIHTQCGCCIVCIFGNVFLCSQACDVSTSCGILRFHNCGSPAFPKRLFSTSLEEIQGQNPLKGQEVIITANNASEEQPAIHHCTVKGPGQDWPPPLLWPYCRSISRHMKIMQIHATQYLVLCKETQKLWHFDKGFFFSLLHLDAWPLAFYSIGCHGYNAVTLPWHQ